MKFEYIAKNPTKSEVSRRVPGAGLEPARYCYQRILSLLVYHRERVALSQYVTKFMRLVLKQKSPAEKRGLIILNR